MTESEIAEALEVSIRTVSGDDASSLTARGILERGRAQVHYAGPSSRRRGLRWPPAADLHSS